MAMRWDEAINETGAGMNWESCLRFRAQLPGNACCLVDVDKTLYRTEELAWERQSQGAAFEELTSQMILSADVMLWRDDIRQASFQGHEAWKLHKLAQADVPTCPQIWLFQHWGDLGPDYGEEFAGAMLCGKLIYPAPIPKSGEVRRWGLGAAAIIRGPDRFRDRSPVEFGVIHRPPLDQGAEIGTYSATFGMLQFLKLPFVRPEKAPVPRQQARAYERRNGRSLEVNIITLRRADRSQGEEGAGLVDWQCQWFVRGHWRKRAERWREGPPSYVTPHLKGPEGKPLKMPKPTVYQVSR